MTCGFLIQLVFCEKKTMWFTGVEVEQETSAPPPKKNPGSAPESRSIVWSRSRIEGTIFPVVSQFFQSSTHKSTVLLKHLLKILLRCWDVAFIAKKYYSTIHFRNIIFTFVIYIPYIIIISTWLTFCVRTYMIFFIASSSQHVTCVADLIINTHSGAKVLKISFTVKFILFKVS